MNVPLPARTPVNLYTATGIDVGTQLRVTNLTTSDVRLAETEEGLTNNHIPLNAYSQATNNASDVGAWAMCTSGGGLNVREVV